MQHLFSFPYCPQGEQPCLGCNIEGCYLTNKLEGELTCDAPVLCLPAIVCVWVQAVVRLFYIKKNKKKKHVFMCFNLLGALPVNLTWLCVGGKKWMPTCFPPLKVSTGLSECWKWRRPRMFVSLFIVLLMSNRCLFLCISVDGGP